MTAPVTLSKDPVAFEDDGRELFAPFRRAVGAAESGASVFF